jgi:hypothetical protein
MIPPVAGMTAVADWAGKTARGFGASPFEAGLISQGVGMMYPTLQKFNATRAARQLAAEEAKVGEAVTGYQKKTLTGAEELGKIRTERDVAKRAAEEGFDFGDPATVKRLQQAREATREAEGGEISTAAQAAQMVSQAQEQARKKIAESENLRDLTAYEARVAIDDLRDYPKVAQAAAEAGKRRLAQTPTPVSEFEFGEKFKGPEFQPRGAKKEGYYRQAEESRRAQADQLYADARAEAAGAEIPAEMIVDPILNELEAQGVAVRAMPTAAERTGIRMTEAIDPEALSVKAEQETFNQVSNSLTQQQVEYLRTGKGTTPGVPGGPPPIPKEVVEMIVGLTQQQGKRKLGVGAESNLERMIRDVQKRDLERGAIAEKAPARTLPVENALVLHQRLNSAIRAADRAKNFQLSGQLKRWKNIVDSAINEVKPEALGKLGEADKFYASEYSPFFDPRSQLFKISRGKAASVVDQIISKDNPALTQKALSILTDEGKADLRGAWVQGVFESAVDPLTGGFSPGKLAAAYRSYLPEVRKMILGEASAREMDELIDGMGKRTMELIEARRARGEAARVAREAVPGAKKEAAELVPAAKAAGRELTEAATARREAAQAAEKATYGTLEREVRGQGERRQVAAATQDAYEKAAAKLADDTMELSKQLVRDSAVKFADQPDFFRTPQGLHMLMGMSNMQVQMALGLIDLAEFAAGVGGRRYVVFAARHLGVLLLAKYPQLLGYLGKYGKKGIEITNKFVNGNPLSPGYTRQAREFFALMQTANFQRVNDERTAETDQEGSENP